MESQFLDVFWKLSSTEEDERLQAATDILQLLEGFRVSVADVGIGIIQNALVCRMHIRRTACVLNWSMPSKDLLKG